MYQIADYLKKFTYSEGDELFPDFDNKKTTITQLISLYDIKIPKYVNEFWTSKQRKSSSIHEISYRACFKPELPRFFINLLSNKGDTIYDPFSGRGTTVIEAALMGRNIIANDVNPLSKILTRARLFVPQIEDIHKRLQKIKLNDIIETKIDLSMFYHKKTLNEILSLKQYLINNEKNKKSDSTDHWIRMIATNRLTGHSPGFFSVYTLPPNQAISPESQIKVNKKNNQVPPYRNTKKIILEKTKRLLRNLINLQIENLKSAGLKAKFVSKNAIHTPEIESNTVNLTITSPPFLDVVQYSKDNWLRCWFNDIDEKEVEKNITVTKKLQEWKNTMQSVFNELYRITKKGGWVAFEVGEVRKGKIKLDEHIVPLGSNAGFDCRGIVINSQKFTKTSNIWGIANNGFGTNSNRIVLFYKN